MMCIMVVKAGKEHFPFVIFIITIGILQEDKATTLGDIHAVMGNLETYGNMQIVRKINLLVGFSIVVCVFKYDQFILGERIADPVMRITGHGRHP